MKPTILIIIFLSAFANLAFGQNKKKLEKAFELSSTDTLWLEFSEHTCFTGNRQIWVVYKSDSTYSVLKIDEFKKVLFFDKNVFAETEIVDKWIMSNLDTLSTIFQISTYSQNDFYELSKILNQIIETNKDCQAVADGNEAEIILKKGSFSFKQEFNCRVNFEKITWHNTAYTK